MTKLDWTDAYRIVGCASDDGYASCSTCWALVRDGDQIAHAEQHIQTSSEGIWVAFNGDGSAFVPFAFELDALRYAASYGMSVKFARYGDEDWMRGRKAGA